MGLFRFGPLYTQFISKWTYNWMHLIASSRSLCHYFLCWFSVQEILKSFWSLPFVGQYQCFAKNKYGTAITNSVFVRKSELNNFKDEPPQTLVVNEGDPFGISCVPPDGWPKPVVYWMRQAQNWIKTINSSRYRSFKVQPTFAFDILLIGNKEYQWNYK